MGSRSEFSNYGSNCQGFYYDVQRQNPLMSITLHANRAAIDGGKSWEDVKDPDSEGYSKTSLCSSLMNEDFSVAVANNWSDFDGGNMIESIWNQTRPLGAYSNHIGKLMGNMVGLGKKWLSERANTEELTNWAEKLNKSVEKAGTYISGNTNYLNHSLVVQGTRFSYYAGTGTSFSNLNMKFTLFADHFEEKGFKTVHEQLNDLYPYLIGKYVNIDGTEKKSNSAEEQNVLNEFFGWQKAPGDFTPDIKNIDNTVKGTLKLKFGNYYSIKNLVVRDAQLNFSRQMVKHNGSSSFVDYSPLYCEVMISLQPATKFSDIALRQFVEGGSTTKERDEFSKKLRTDLDNIRTRMSNVIDSYK